eukprot:7378952-Prymnesium_polylepis.1
MGMGVCRRAHTWPRGHTATCRCSPARATRRCAAPPRAATPHAASRRLTLPQAAPCPLAPTHGRATTHGAMGMEVCSRRRPPAARLPRRCDRDSDRAACALAAHA